MDLTNASAIVTGGAGGFGSATVRRTDERGEALAQGGRRRLALRADRLHGRRRHRQGGQAASGLGHMWPRRSS
jgi:NADP-dependent 3-hydroxy acid dehydrogenase YdfG